MIKRIKFRNKLKIITIVVSVGLGLCIVTSGFCIFFDEAVLVRKGTVYRVVKGKKLIALTFDDGPSPEWTPQILSELKEAGVKATFFMLGKHVEKYPEIAISVATAGHDIGNHTYDHHVLLYYKNHELENQIKHTEKIIKSITGISTHYFRPPKAWLTKSDKRQIKALGYETILWSLNSKDWVTWDDKFIVKHLTHHVTNGDIILFHDGGGVFKTEGGDRHETVKTIPKLVKALRARGYRFVTISELLQEDKKPNSKYD